MSFHTELPTKSGEPGQRVERLDSGGFLRVPIWARFSDDVIEVSIKVDVANGVPMCPSFDVRRKDGRGLEEMSTEIARGVKLRELMAQAAAQGAMQQISDDPGDGLRWATSVEAIEAVVGTIRRTREPTTDDRLSEVANAYRERWVTGGSAEFAESLHVSERQMWRLVRLARQRGFLVEGDK